MVPQLESQTSLDKPDVLSYWWRPLHQKSQLLLLLGRIQGEFVHRQIQKTQTFTDSLHQDSGLNEDHVPRDLIRHSSLARAPLDRSSPQRTQRKHRILLGLFNMAPKGAAIMLHMIAKGKAQKGKMSELIFPLLNFPQTMLTNRNLRVSAFFLKIAVMKLKLMIKRKQK